MIILDTTVLVYAVGEDHRWAAGVPLVSADRAFSEVVGLTHWLPDAVDVDA